MTEAILRLVKTSQGPLLIRSDLASYFIVFALLFELQSNPTFLPFSQVAKLFQLFKKFTCFFIQNSTNILEPHEPFNVGSMTESDFEPMLDKIFVATSVQRTENRQCFTVLPIGLNSLKLMHDLPTTIWVVIQTNQFVRPTFDQELLNLIQYSVKLIEIQPTEEQKSNRLFNEETYTEFISVQVKYLSLISFMSRSIYDEKLQSLNVPERLPYFILQLLRNCPKEAVNIRRDLFVAIRYINATRFRLHFLPYMGEFFKESVLIGEGWSCRQTLRQLAYSVVYDLTHHLRENLSTRELLTAINTYSKNLYDDSVSITLHVMSCRLIINLADSFSKVAEREKCSAQVMPVLLKIFEMFADKV